MKTTIKIKNFRSLEDVEIELAPTTILVGPNGAGKSSLLKSINFIGNNIKNISSNRERKTIYYLPGKRDLGSFKEIVYKNDIHRDIHFELNFESDIDTYDEKMTFENKFWPWGSSEYLSSNNEILKKYCGINGLHLLEKFNTSEKNRLEFLKQHTTSFRFLIKVKFSHHNEEYNLRHFELNDLETDYTLVIDYDNGYMTGHYLGDKLISTHPLLEQLIKPLNRISFRWLVKSSFISDYEFGDNSIMSSFEIGTNAGKNISRFLPAILKSNKCAKALLDLSEKQREEILFIFIAQQMKLFEFFPRILRTIFDIEHLKSTREAPPRYYDVKTKVFQNLYPDSIFSSDKVNETDSRHFDINNGKRTKISSDIINQWLTKYELGKYLIKEEGQYRGQIKLRNLNDSVVNIIEASSGFIQLYPLIRASLPEYNIWFPRYLFIEQPELHLHPKLQGMLSELFAHLKTNPIRSKHFIVETHSEHLIKAYQIAIAKGEIKTSNIKFYYFMPDGQITKVKELLIDNKGNFLTEWPNGFFSESSDLSFQLLEAQIKRNE